MFLRLIKYIAGRETDYNIIHIHSANYILSSLLYHLFIKYP